MLQASSDEFAALFDTILINVTSFYRDPEAWQFIQDEVVRRYSPVVGRRNRSGSGARDADPARRPTRWP